MALIKHYTKKAGEKSHTCEIHEFDGFAWEWIVENIPAGSNFSVYEGGTTKDCEISRNHERMESATDVSIIDLPAGGLELVIVAVVVAVATVALMPKPKPFDNVNRQQQSPNNALSDRRNVPRPNQRIPDICGKVKAIPDTIQQEFAFYENNIEKRIGYYCVGRGPLLIEQVQEGDQVASLLGNYSAGIYQPFKSPNNSAPDAQIGEPINHRVVGVTQSSEVVGQLIEAPNQTSVELTKDMFATPNGVITDYGNSVDFTEYFAAGDDIVLSNVTCRVVVSGANAPYISYIKIGELTNKVTSVTVSSISFDISNDPSWSEIGTTSGEGRIGDSNNPRLSKATNYNLGPIAISSVKVNEVVVNVYAPNGMFTDNGSRIGKRSVQFTVTYQRLDDALNPIGTQTQVSGVVSGSSSEERGSTVRFDIGAASYVQINVKRDTPKDFDFNGSVVDDIKLKSVFGLYDIPNPNFGNVTTIQVQRSAVASQVKEAELNCLATEMLNEYQGNGVFSPSLTPNTRAMQSLIRVALDDRIGRRQLSEIDADLFLAAQSEVESYFGSASAGSFNYTFDSTNTTAQEILYSIANAAFTVIWREGRVLKCKVERPQTVPAMVFTHRSKRPDSETWVRSSDRKNDSIKFKYTDSSTYTQEIITIPESGGTNPKTIEIPGIKGIEQATWRANREYNKLLYSEISVDFVADESGRFVKPNTLISVVKGTRIAAYDGEVRALDGLTMTLSQEVEFTEGDDHFILLKGRDGSLEAIPATATTNKRVITLGFFPIAEVYTGTSEKRTEFSFGNEARLRGQWILPQSIDPSDNRSVAITGIGYSDLFYKDDGAQVIFGSFSDDFSDDFDI